MPCSNGQDSPDRFTAVAKLAVMGEQAGFTVSQMIKLLQDGVSVRTLFEMIEWRLGGDTLSLR